MLRLLGSKSFINISALRYSTTIAIETNQRSLSSILTSNSSKTKLNKDFINKIKNLPVKINTNYLDLSTLDRLNLCSNDFLIDLLHNLDTYGIKDKHLTNILKSHDDWSLLTKNKLSQTFQMFRELAFTSDIYLELISRNQQLIQMDKRKLEVRLHDFKYFFTNKQMDKLLLKTPDLLTCNFDNFTYKFTYLFVLMGIDQEEQCKTNVYDHNIDHIRQRHLFLQRSAYFDKPNKKGISKVVNPKFKDIVDSNLKEYLRICTNDIFDLQQFQTFCDYLKEENFEDELLGQRIGSSLQKKIIYNVKQSKYENREYY